MFQWLRVYTGCFIRYEHAFDDANTKHKKNNKTDFYKRLSYPNIYSHINLLLISKERTEND